MIGGKGAVLCPFFCFRCPCPYVPAERNAGEDGIFIPARGLYRFTRPSLLCRQDVRPPRSLAALPLPVRIQRVPALEYILAPSAIVLIAVIVYLSTRYNEGGALGTAFYLATVFPAIQLIPVGHARAADRYTYVPLIGIFFIVGMFLAWLWKKIPAKNGALKAISLGLGGLAVISLVWLTVAQTGVWKSNKTLWNTLSRKIRTAILRTITSAANTTG